MENTLILIIISIILISVTITYFNPSKEQNFEKPLKLSQVKYWAYQIQGIENPGVVGELSNSNYDMLVIEPTRTDWSCNDTKNFDTKRMVKHLKNSKASDKIHKKLVIAYVNIGEAEDWRWYWKWSKWQSFDTRPKNLPEYILVPDPDGWSGNFPVAYWDPAWKDTVIHGKNQDFSTDRDYESVIDEVMDDGFDGVYLDWVEGYENEAVIAEARKQGRDPELEMIKFITEIRDYAKSRDPDFVIIQQNGVGLCEGHPELFSIIDGISQEAIWYDGTAFDDWNDPKGYDVPTDPMLTNHYLDYLKMYQNAGVSVFNCEYALFYSDDAYEKSKNLGFIAYCTRRSLSNITTVPPF